MATASGFRAVGGCRCDSNPVRYEYTKRPFETHFCCCTDCTDICGGALQAAVPIPVWVTSPSCSRSAAAVRCGWAPTAPRRRARSSPRIPSAA